MSTKIQKWGNSMGVRIPKSILEQAGLEEGSEVKVKYHNGQLVIIPKYDLRQLIDQISQDNLPEHDDFLPEGKEVW